MPIDVGGVHIPLPGDPDWHPFGVGQPSAPPPPQPQGPPDITARQRVVDAVATQHQGVLGGPAPVTEPNPDFDKGKPEGPGNLKDRPTTAIQYTFGDGSTIQIQPDGTVEDFTAKAETKPVASPLAKWTPIVDPNNADHKGMQDPVTGQIIWSTEAKNDKPSAIADWVPFVDPNDPEHRGLQDPVTHEIIWTPKPAKDAKQPAPFDQWKPIADPNDPNHKGMQDPGTGSIVWSPAPKEPTPISAASITYQPIEGSDDKQGGVVLSDGSFKAIPGLIQKKGEEAAAVVGGINDKTWAVVNKQGQTTSTYPNPIYTPKAPTQLQPDTVSAKVPMLKADGTIDWVDNQNRQTISQGMADLLNQVGVKVAAGTISVDEGKSLLTAAVNRMQAETQQADVAQRAAQALLTNQAQGATTGAGLLQNRVSTAASLLSNVLQAGNQGNERFGNFSGGTVPWAPGTGQLLVNGIQQYLTGLGGGQDVYDTAARLVKQSDPTAPGDHPAIGALNDLLTAYHGATGQPHQTVLDTQALKGQAGGANGGQQQQQTGFVSPPANRTAEQIQAGLSQPGSQFSQPPLGATPTPSPVSLQSAQPPQTTGSPFAGAQAASLNPPTQVSGSTVPYQIAGASLPQNPMFDAQGNYMGPANFNFSGQSFQAPTTVPYTVQPGPANVRPLTMAQLGAT